MVRMEIFCLRGATFWRRARHSPLRFRSLRSPRADRIVPTRGGSSWDDRSRRGGRLKVEGSVHGRNEDCEEEHAEGDPKGDPAKFIERVQSLHPFSLHGLRRTLSISAVSIFNDSTRRTIGLTCGNMSQV
nr:unnamed protein product [Methylocystis sp. SC2]